MGDVPLALGEYKVDKRIARGGFGYVHLGKAPDGKLVAIKYERTSDRVQRPYLQHEAEVYRLLEGHPCVPKIYAFGREGRRNIMVFDLLGPSLETLLEDCGGSFSLKTMLMLAPQIIDAIEYCHSKGIIHRDLKPDNLLMGLDDRAKFVHIIDFGLARRFRHPRTLEHFPYFDGHSFFGTTRFASLQALEGCSQSRRDDLESAAYSLIYFVRKRLPWQGLRGGTEKHRDQRVREKKRTWAPKRLCVELPGGEELSKMLEHVKNLGYTDEPDYAYLKGLFRERFEKEGFVLDYDYDWLHLPECEDQSVLGSETGSRVEMPARETSAHPPGADHKDANSESRLFGPPINIGASGSVHGESTKRRSELPPIMTSRGLSELKLIDVYGSKAKKRNNQTPAGSKNASIRGSRSPHPSSAGSHQAIKDLPVQAGDLVLIKFLARPTLEWGDLGSDSRAPTDTSYWHNPSLSKDDWHFSFRPAVVQKVHFTKRSYTKLTVLPIMQRSDGLDNVPPSRRSAFIKINKGDETAANTRSDDDEGLELNLTPAWPFEGTYTHFLRDDFDIQVPTETINDIEVIWRLDREQLKKLHKERENTGDVFKARDNTDLSEGGHETYGVRRRQALRPGWVKYTLFGDIASLTEEAFGRPDVEVKGSNGWLPEFYKVDRRRNHENGHYTDDSDTYSSNDEDVSFTSEGPPGNRRLSCTLAIDGDVIVEAASQDGSERGSRYRSPRASKFASISSRASSRRRTASSTTGSIAQSPRSLRHAVLDSIPRSRLNSPVFHDHESDSDINRDTSTGIDTDSSPRVNSESGAASSLTLSSSHPSLDDSGSHERSSSALAPFSSSNESIIGSSSNSFVTRTSSVVSSRSCSCSESEGYISSDIGSVESAGVNKLASLIEGKLMIDRGIQTDDINEEASEATGKVMVDKGIQTQA